MTAAKFSMAGLADTGQWRLILAISESGIHALLKNTLFEEEPPVILLKKEWVVPSSELLSAIEDAVYETPRIFDDFATHIVIESAKSLWIPTEYTEEEEFNEDYFTCVFPSKSVDIFADFGENETCVYTLCPGLSSFLKRTLPGCKISSHLSVLKEHIEKKKPDTELFIIKDKYNTNIFTFRKGKFLSGTCYDCLSIEETALKALMTLKTYGIGAQEARCNLVCKNEDFNKFKEMLRDLIPHIKLMDLPPLVRDEGIVLSAAIVAGETF